MQKFLEENLPKGKNWKHCICNTNSDFVLKEEDNPKSIFNVSNSKDVQVLKIDSCLIGRGANVYYKYLNKDKVEELRRKCDYCFSVENDKIVFVELKPDIEKQDLSALDDYFNAVEQITQTIHYFKNICKDTGNTFTSYFSELFAFVSMGTDVTNIDDNKRTTDQNTAEEKYYTIAQTNNLPEVKQQINTNKF